MGITSKLDTYLTHHHLIKIEVDLNIFTNPYDNGQFIILFVYVDDCIVVNNHLHHIFALKQLLEMEFEISHVGDINYCLGIHII